MLIFFLFSCDRFHENNYDFPKRITFPAEGGTQYYLGGTVVSDFYISDKSSEDGGWGHGLGTGDPMVASYDWLTVQGEKFKDGLTITAAPNTSKDPRFLTIEIGTGATEYGYIKVRQNGKTEK